MNNAAPVWSRQCWNPKKVVDTFWKFCWKNKMRRALQLHVICWCFTPLFVLQAFNFMEINTISWWWLIGFSQMDFNQVICFMVLDSIMKARYCVKPTEFASCWKKNADTFGLRITSRPVANKAVLGTKNINLIRIPRIEFSWKFSFRNNGILSDCGWKITIMNYYCLNEQLNCLNVSTI